MKPVDQKDLKLPFNDVIDGLPEHSGRLHGHMADPFRYQPVAKSQQVASHCSKGAHLRMNLPLVINASDAGSHCLTVNIQSSTATKNRFPHLRHSRIPQLVPQWRPPKNETICFA